MRSNIITLVFLALGALLGNSKDASNPIHFYRYVDSDIINENRIININVENIDSNTKVFKATIPIYEFKDSNVGNFFKQFCDTTFKYDRKSCKLFGPISEKSNFSAILQDVYDIEKHMDMIRGIIVMKGSPDIFQMLILFNDNPIWLKNVGIEKTKEDVTLFLKVCPGILIESEFSYQASMMVAPSGKVNITNLYYGDKPLLWHINRPKTNKDIYKINNWIREYYKEHGFSVNRIYLDE